LRGLEGRETWGRSYNERLGDGQGRSYNLTFFDAA
jgi:hypothetical protein